MYSLPTISLIIGSAAIDSINPFAIGLLVLILTLALGSGMSAKRIFWLGATYILTVFAAYLLAGLGLTRLLADIPVGWAQYFTIAIGLIIAIIAVIEIKDYFWRDWGPSLQIPPKITGKIHKFLASRLSIATIALLALLVTAVELPSTGAPYLAVIALIKLSFGLPAFLLLVLYNFIFVLPLIIILGLVLGETKLSSIAKWRESSRETMHLATGILLTLLGWILILSANGTLNFS